MTGIDKKKVMIDRTVAAGLIVICGVMYRIAGEYPAGGDYFPKFSLGVIMIMSALMLVLSFCSRNGCEAGNPAESAMCIIRPAIMILFFVLYLLIYPTVGFYFSTALFTVVVMAFLKVKRLKTYLLVVPVLTISFYGFFGLLLDVPFPDSWLL